MTGHLNASAEKTGQTPKSGSGHFLEHRREALRCGSTKMRQHIEVLGTQPHAGTGH